jgi:phage tail protein X
MPGSRLNTIKIKYNNKKRYYKALKYPEIPLSSDDIYIRTTVGDRLDNLAHQFYKDVDLWWIISTANPGIIRRDSLNLKPGLEIRIPTSVLEITQQFEFINK